MIYSTVRWKNVFFEVFVRGYGKPYNESTKAFRKVKRMEEGKFSKFISCVAARISQEVNLADIAKDVDIDRKTVIPVIQ